MLVTAYANGMTLGTPPPPRDHSQDAKRGRIVGWTPDAVRRHKKWLYGVQAPELDGLGLAFTLTLRDCPPDAESWSRVLRALVKRLERAGAVRLHWVVEWQRRKVPHLHGAVYFPAGTEEHVAIAQVFVAWFAVAKPYGAGVRSQTVDVISGTVGWLQYLSKHAARGVAHYQRQGRPEGWESTGRLWGKRGTWPLAEPMRFDVDRAGGNRLRRLVRSWRVADARAALAQQIANPVRDPIEQAKRERTARQRIRSARGMLRCSDPKRAAVRGASEWLGEEVTIALVWMLVGEGHAVVQRVEVDDDAAE